LKNSNKNYILDLGFFKSVSYYFLRSKTPESDISYLRLLADLKEKLHQVSKKNKHELIEKLKKDKKKKMDN
jgi:hypothetical protein